MELENRCPIIVRESYECNAIGLCPNGEPRDNDTNCDCPSWEFPACPATECNSHLPRQIDNCMCIEEPVNQALSVRTERVNETVFVRWDVNEDDSTIDSVVDY